MAHVNGAIVSGNPRHLEVLRIAWDAKFRRLLEGDTAGMGKTYTSSMYGCAEAVGLLSRSDEAAGQERRG